MVNDNLKPFKFYKDSCGEANYVGVVFAENEIQAKEIMTSYYLIGVSGYGVSGYSPMGSPNHVSSEDDITIEPVILVEGNIIIVDKY